MRIRPNHEQNVRLTVRPLASEDLDGYIAYFSRPSKADAERMGLAIDRVPPATRLRSELEAMIAAPPDWLHSFALAWCVDGKTIGHSSLKDILPGDFGSGAPICGVRATARASFACQRSISTSDSI